MTACRLRHDIRCSKFDERTVLARWNSDYSPTPEPVVKCVLAAANREFNCDFTTIYGTVQNANNFPLAGVEVRALGIHETTGLDFAVRTDADGRYEAFRFPLADLSGA